MRVKKLAIAAAALLMPGVAVARVPGGVWQNPKGTVRVQFHSCGPAMCGRVVWASADAQAQVRAAGGGTLVGSDLFRDLVPEGANRWSGSVLIPDIGQTVTGSITQANATTLIGEGCLFAGIGCRQQVWHKVG